MKKFLFLVFLTIIFIGCKTNDYDVTSPYGAKTKRDLEVFKYEDLGNGFGNYQIFGPAGGNKQDQYKNMGWRLWQEAKPRDFVSSDQDGFVMQLNNVHDGAIIIWDGFGYYKYVNDDYGYSLYWQDFSSFVEQSIYQIVQDGRKTVAVKLAHGKIYKMNEDIGQNTGKFPWENYAGGKGNDYNGYAIKVTGNEKVIRLWANGNLVQGAKNNPYFFGDFSGDEIKAWELIPAKDDVIKGWWYIDIGYQDSLDVYFGFGGIYDSNAQNPFINTNFEHMPFCYGWGCGPNGENGSDDSTKDIYLKIRQKMIQDPCQ